LEEVKKEEDFVLPPIEDKPEFNKAQEDLEMEKALMASFSSMNMEAGFNEPSQ
jgi:hypothetical protein